MEIICQGFLGNHDTTSVKELDSIFAAITLLGLLKLQSAFPPLIPRSANCLQVSIPLFSLRPVTIQLLVWISH